MRHRYSERRRVCYAGAACACELSMPPGAAWLRPVAALVVVAALAPQAAAEAAVAAACGPSALPGLEAARARVPPAASGQASVVLTAVRVASADEFLHIAAAVTGLPPDAPDLEQLVGGRGMPLPCTAAVIARDRLTYALLLGGYSAREIADIVSGRLAKSDLDDAHRLLMSGQDESVAAAFLDRALARRQQRAAQGSGRTSPQPPGTPPPVLVAEVNVRDAIARFARQYQVDPALVLAMMAAESAGAHDAVSAKGAIGLLQLMPATARMLGVDPADPVDNLRGGIAYLAGLLAQFGNTRDALIAYNAGPSHAARVRKGLTVLYGETRRYLETIGRLYPL